MDAGLDASQADVVFPQCHTTNRVAADALLAQRRCRQCGQALFDGHPVALSGVQFERHIANSGLPVVVDFWAPWCGPCRAMAPVFERAAQEVEPRARFVKLNTDEERSLAMRHGIRGIPTLAIFKQGVEVARVAGVIDAARFIAWVRAHA